MLRALLVLALLSCATACSWGTGSETAIGRVNDVQGKPRVFRGDRYLELGPGAGLEIGDSVITYSLDRVEVKLRDGTMLRAGGDVQLTIREYSYKGGPSKLRLTSSGGRYRLTTGKSFKGVGSSLEISTPSAIIQSGEADLLVEHDNDAQSMIVMRLGSGLISVRNQFGETELLRRGEMSSVSFGLLPSQPMPAEESELDNAVKSTSLPNR